MKLGALSAAANGAVLHGDGETEITGLAYDSRDVQKGDLFVALAGEKVDGRAFVAQAVEAGAAAVAVRGAPEGDWDCPVVQVDDTQGALASFAALFFGHPSRELKVAGITGTNGKSTTALLAKHLLDAAHHRAGLLGTISYDTGDGEKPASHTTPQSLNLQQLFSEMRENGCRSAVMEVSSHGLHQKRVGSVHFDVAVFTNLSQDHLDYHGTMEEYFKAKCILFEMTADNDGLLVVNGDDDYGRRLISDFSGNAKCISFGSRVGNDFRISNWRSNLDGTEFTLEAKGREMLVRIPLIGRFNVFNAVAALGIADGCGCNFRESVRALASAPQVPGRLESVSLDAPFRVFVDYAHTPDALSNVVSAVRELDPRRIITLFGCGGDRDRDKRPLMAAAAEEGSDFCILTSDNPRSEDLDQIMADAKKGFTGSRFTEIADRREAIREAVLNAKPRDVILIAGKGHETYQEINGERFPFDDREVARGFIREANDIKAEFRREKEKEHREREWDRKMRDERGQSWDSRNNDRN